MGRRPKLQVYVSYLEQRGLTGARACGVSAPDFAVSRWARVRTRESGRLASRRPALVAARAGKVGGRMRRDHASLGNRGAGCDGGTHWERGLKASARARATSPRRLASVGVLVRVRRKGVAAPLPRLRLVMEPRGQRCCCCGVASRLHGR